MVHEARHHLEYGEVGAHSLCSFLFLTQKRVLIKGHLHATYRLQHDWFVSAAGYDHIHKMYHRNFRIIDNTCQSLFPHASAALW